MFVRHTVSAPSSQPESHVKGYRPLPAIKIATTTAPEAEAMDWFSASPPSPGFPPRDATLSRAAGQLAAATFAKFAANLDGMLDRAHFWRRAILHRYAEPQRHYHTIEHVEAMLRGLLNHQDMVVEPQVVTLAILFHDVVYDPRRHDNEEASMEVFSQCADDLELPQALRESVLHLIERTKTHDGSHADHPDLPLFLDLDLEVLSRSPEAYAQYAKSIQQEYAHVPKPLFAYLRAGVLRTFLDRDTLYYTPRFLELHEDRARQNVWGEMKELEDTGRSLSSRAWIAAWQMKTYLKSKR